MHYRTFLAAIGALVAAGPWSQSPNLLRTRPSDTHLAISRSRGAVRADTRFRCSAQLSTAVALRLGSFQTAILDRDARRACFQANRKPATPSRPLARVRRVS
jgi:hypothetical protein